MGEIRVRAYPAKAINKGHALVGLTKPRKREPMELASGGYGRRAPGIAAFRGPAVGHDAGGGAAVRVNQRPARTRPTPATVSERTRAGQAARLLPPLTGTVV